MELYGFYVFNHHGWAKILTVLSPEGADAAFRHIEVGDDLIVTGGDGRLPRYQAKSGRALEDLIERYAIKVLDREEWVAKKAELATAGSADND